jgi:hypothetical protein
LFTKNGKALTAKGVKPICPFHQVFKSTYLFGAFSPAPLDFVQKRFAGLILRRSLSFVFSFI